MEQKFNVKNILIGFLVLLNILLLYKTKSEITDNDNVSNKNTFKMLNVIKTIKLIDFKTENTIELDKSKPYVILLYGQNSCSSCIVRASEYLEEKIKEKVKFYKVAIDITHEDTNKRFIKNNNNNYKLKEIEISPSDYKIEKNIVLFMDGNNVVKIKEIGYLEDITQDEHFVNFLDYFIRQI